MPSSPPGKTWTPRQLKELAVEGNNLHLFPLSNSSSYSWLRAEDGWGVFDASNAIDTQQNRKEASSIAFAFQTGEVWSLDTALLARDTKRIPFIEPIFTNRFSQYANFLKLLGVPPPYHCIAGITGVRGRLLVVPPDPAFLSIGSGGPLCLGETIEVEGMYEAGQTPVKALLTFYTAIFEKCGMERPSYLDR